MSTGKHNVDEQKRINNILLDMAETKEVYQTEFKYWDERLMEKLRGISIWFKIILIIAIFILAIFLGLIGYNFLKSYGQEKGKVLARK